MKVCTMTSRFGKLALFFSIHGLQIFFQNIRSEEGKKYQ